MDFEQLVRHVRGMPVGEAKNLIEQSGYVACVVMQDGMNVAYDANSHRIVINLEVIDGIVTDSRTG